MPEPCTLEPVGRYAVKHNPWAYFSSSTSRHNCGRFDVPAGALETARCVTMSTLARCPPSG